MTSLDYMKGLKEIDLNKNREDKRYKKLLGDSKE